MFRIEISSAYARSVQSNVRPVDFMGFTVPKEFSVEFACRSLNENARAYWTVELFVRMERGGVPRAIETRIKGDIYSSKSRVELALRGRLEPQALQMVGNDLRYLEAVAVRVVANTWVFAPWKEGTTPERYEWCDRTKLNFEDGLAPRFEGDISFKTLKQIEREALQRSGYTRLSPEFLAEVARIYNLAVDQKKRTNIAVKDFFEVRDKQIYSIKTIQKWVAKARRDGFISTPELIRAQPNKTGLSQKSRRRK